MEQPEGFIEHGFEDHIWELQRGLYDMKQGGQVWNKTRNSQLVDWGFTRLNCEYCVYYHHDPDGIVVVAIHVDDFFMLRSSKLSLLKFREQLQTRWQISDRGPAHFHIGIAIEHDCVNRTIALSQVALIDRIISQFSLFDAHPISTPFEPGLRLSKANSPQTNEEHADVARLPYHKLIIEIARTSIAQGQEGSAILVETY